MTTTDNSRADALTVLADLLSYAERQICMHENTHRGGAIWEICDDCGAQWADDQGGKPEFQWPKEIVAARSLFNGLAVEQHEAAPAAQPSERGIYAWIAEGSAALVRVHTRPTDHSPGNVLNGSLIRNCTFYDGCAIEQWSGGTWYGPLKHPAVNMKPEPQPAPSAPLEGTGNGADERAAYMLEAAAIASTHCTTCAELIKSRIGARAPRTEVAGGAAMACPTCGGSQTTWKCTCEPMWEGYTPPSADAAAAPADERAAFEAWMRTGELDLTPTLERDGDVYDDFDTQRAWRGWQARAGASQPAAAAGQEAVAWFDKALNNVRWKDGLVNDDFRDGQPFYTAPPAQIATRERLTDEHIDRAMALAHAWATATYYKGLGKPHIDFDETRRELRALLEGAKQ
ncbi:hypothetical protein [Burkholderia ambifaria]|uniref:hypothetical protein n=1 Tax=Burkholderia ambifaria TaxID=152480 RepID=UPI00158A3DA3|nr:hypothetical protein [Burkholderia ambifaria]